MRIAVLFATFLAMATLAPARPDDDKKPDDKAKAKPKQVVVGQLQGEISEIAKDGRRFVLEVEGQVPYWSTSSSPRSKTPPRLKSKKQKAEIEVTLADDAKVRLPIKPDDEEARKSAKESKDKLPGKPGEVGDLKKDQIVIVTFVQTKETPPKLYGSLVLVVKDKLK